MMRATSSGQPALSSRNRHEWTLEEGEEEEDGRMNVQVGLLEETWNRAAAAPPKTPFD